MSLVHVNFAFASHVEEALLRVNITLWRDPRRRVDGTPQRLVFDVFPLNCQGNGIFRFNTLALGDSRGACGSNSNWSRYRGKCPFRPINVMRTLKKSRRK